MWAAAVLQSLGSSDLQQPRELEFYTLEKLQAGYQVHLEGAAIARWVATGRQLLMLLQLQLVRVLLIRLDEGVRQVVLQEDYHQVVQPDWPALRQEWL